MPDSDLQETRVRGGHRSRVTTLLKELSVSLEIPETTEAWVQDHVDEIQRQKIISRPRFQNFVEL